MKKGFTLIELMIVMAVIAILIGIALPRIKGMQDEGNVAKAKGELRALQTAVTSYYIHHNNTYPATSATISVALLAASPKIIEAALYDPFGATSTTEYNYILNGQYFVIISLGADRAADITGISAAGVLAGDDDDDEYVTNGSGF